MGTLCNLIRKKGQMGNVERPKRVSFNRRETLSASREPDYSATPIFRWAGSKRKTLHVLERFWSDRFNRYIEPFVGSACLFLRIQPESAVLSDLNSSLIETYRNIRDHPQEVARRLYLIPRSARAYYAVREKLKTTTNSLDRASMFVYLNRNCFNGIYRTNLSGEFNVPFGNKQGKYPGLSEFQSVSRRLRSTKLLTGDFGATLLHVRRDDFVYLDPPFAATGVRTFVEYGKRSFGSSDLDRLAKHLKRIDRKHAYFVVSYADCPRAREIAKEWNFKPIEVRRQIAGFTDRRKMATELLITNLPLPEGLCHR